MKKTFFIVCSLIFGLILSSFTGISAEEQTKYFGVGDTQVSKVEGQTYKVSTKGKKQDEGFVFTPKNIKPGSQITTQLELKGKGEVIIRVSETNAKGKFIKESIGEPIKLTDEWQNVQHNLMLSPETAEIDVMVLTNRKQQATFQFKNVQIKNHESPTL
ncbi:hypothetical protein [Salinibacillus xinjiangensis]|uniref:Uncharacterized protein n=1 Tax=Salinibacillus xinjiangensis TaxID=1229268 RepID=A0A6G1X937_9BACI|nr:hypothetical protein [Salinibacillus xinjiangensis]MRG87484.1 hypothetical protein [Salinibacillus xinjiangensis]